MVAVYPEYCFFLDFFKLIGVGDFSRVLSLVALADSQPRISSAFLIIPQPICLPSFVEGTSPHPRDYSFSWDLVKGALTA